MGLNEPAAAGGKPVGDEPAGGKPAGDELAGDKPAGDEPAGDEPADDKPVGAGDEPGNEGQVETISEGKTARNFSSQTPKTMNTNTRHSQITIVSA
ncbi:MAG: hypothetical protein LBT71_04715 [Azoarcus sp.]|jgi:hypothetical protein|nr:hypothetical protein [Azoarcus sp.]